MRAVDTNILVRLFVNDDPKQAAAARQVVAAEPIFVSKTVILELEWVLRSLYRHAPDAIASAIEWPDCPIFEKRDTSGVTSKRLPLDVFGMA